MNNLPLLECKDVVKKYSSYKIVLDKLNLQINKGRIIGLLGPNGSGKTTLIKLINGLLTQDSGEILINGLKPGVETKRDISYLPERTYLNSWMRVRELVTFFSEFYTDFNSQKAYGMLQKLNINPEDKLKTLSKGTKEKVQLVLVMSREAKLYILDEPIGGVDPAARDYILNTIISNYNPDSSILMSTHLIYDIEKVLDDVLFINNGQIVLSDSVDNIRTNHNKSVDELFREVFKC